MVALYIKWVIEKGVRKKRNGFGSARRCPSLQAGQKEKAVAGSTSGAATAGREAAFDRWSYGVHWSTRRRSQHQIGNKLDRDPEFIKHL